jgi:hypothetical protein
VSGPLRVGGRARLPTGETVVWSVAEGRRGRRWRAFSMRDGALVRGELLETGRDGRPTRLELATAAGLLTLHPEPDESEIHGNVVTPDGVRHLAFAWSPRHVLLVEGSVIVAAASLARLTGSFGVGESRELAVLAIDDRLRPLEGVRLAMRVDASTWRLGERTIALDAAGLPRFPGDVRWPLERE